MDKEYLQEAAKVIQAKLPDNHGFILLALPFGEGRVAYISSLRGKDANRDLSAKERAEAQIALYAPCACGSGKKFKFCCRKP